ncbi:hypothetical protein [Schlesneria sp. T3-172]|uniref:hypothetical protein n=1 Tax=Schlesneria sphaerica TaxID=3373610 RepID=UPI0037C6DFA8
MRQTARFVCLALSGLLLMGPSIARSADKYKLEEPVDDVRVFGVGTRVDVSGKLLVAPKAEPLSQSVSAALSYRERRLLGPGAEAESFRSVREYETAQAEINVDSNKTAIKLPDPLKLIVAQGRPDGVELYGLAGLLTANELDLIRSPADSLALIALLPNKEVEVGDEWTVPGWAFQMLTALDAVIKGELKCKLESIEKGVARIRMNGKLEGAAVGSTTEVTVSGFYSYHLEGKYISDTDFVQLETRAVGPVSPGLEIKAHIRLLRQPAKVPGRLGDRKIIDQSSEEPDESAKYIRFESPWNIGLQHGRHWHLFKVDENVAVFRLLDQGNFVAQCDMASIAAAKPGEHLPEQTFLSDIRRSLGDRVRSMSKGDVVPSSDRKFVFKVMAEGLVGERAMTWVFYLVADPSGRQASLMFSVDTSLVPTMGKHDRELVDSLKFGPAPPPRAAGR